MTKSLKGILSLKIKLILNENLGVNFKIVMTFSLYIKRAPSFTEKNKKKVQLDEEVWPGVYFFMDQLSDSIPLKLFLAK